MNHIHYLYSWREQRREEAIRETRRWPSKGESLAHGSLDLGVSS
jgi:hypothetical protein